MPGAARAAILGAAGGGLGHNPLPQRLTTDRLLLAGDTPRLLRELRIREGLHLLDTAGTQIGAGVEYERAASEGLYLTDATVLMPAWAPTDASGLRLWIEGDGSGSLRGAPSGTTTTGDLHDGHAAILAAASGDTVFCSQWNDASGGARNVAQPTGSRQPAFTPSPFGNLGAMRYSSGNLRLFGPTSDNYMNASAWTIGVVFEVSSIVTNNATIYKNECILSNFARYFGLHLKNLGGGSYTVTAYAFDGARREIARNLELDTPYVGLWWHDGTNMHFQLNTGAVGSTAMGAVAQLTSELCIGASAEVIAMIGDLGATVIYNVDIGAAARAKLRLYLAAKAGVVL